MGVRKGKEKMEFPRDDLLEKYVHLYEQWVVPYSPDFDVEDGATRYIKFNDAWRGLNPFGKFLLPRLTNRKNTFPQKTSDKLSKNANPANYVTLRYDKDGNLKTARIGEKGVDDLVFVYVSRQLTIGYHVNFTQGRAVKYDFYNFEWYEYDDDGRLISAEEFQGYGNPEDDVIINCEYYEYDGNVLSRAQCFKEFQKYPIEATIKMVKQMVPDRIFNPDQFEYSFQRVEDGLDYICNHYYRESQTITDSDHISEETLTHLAKNGLRLI